MAGLTPEGFSAKTQTEIVADTIENQQAVISPTWDPDPDQPTGQIIGINARSQAFLWELLEDVYQSLNRDSAEGEQLDNIGKVIGIPRRSALPSEVTLRCGLSTGASLIAGQSFAESESVPGQLWTPKEDFTSPAGAFYDLRFETLEDGPIEAPAGFISIINTPVTGWDSVSQPTDADLGRDAETDPEYRERQEDSLGVSGSTNADAIRAAVLGVEGVSDCRVLENETSTPTDLPPHSFEVVISDGQPTIADDDAVAQVIWETKAAGIQAFGSVTGNAIDSTGQVRPQSFSRVTGVDIYLEIDLEYGAGYDISNQTVIDALLAFNPDVAQDLVPSALSGQVFKSAAGVENVTQVRIGNTSSPVFTSRYVIGSDQRAIFDTSRIVVNATPWVDD
tara:strand:- start:1428 stop:2606 length:1179 start_codon:yes stop_codon:yes gene_type:complete